MQLAELGLKSWAERRWLDVPELESLRSDTVATISLPTKDRRLEPYTTGEPIVLPKKGAAPAFNRIAYAAAHVVADPLADVDPWLEPAVDWEQTIAFREYLWDLGLGVAEAMDTAQRGMGLDWSGARELIRRALEAAKARPGVKIACGVGTDHLEPGPDVRRRRRHPRLRGADRGDRGDGRTADRDGEPRARGRRQGPGGLRARLRPHPARRCRSR